jgi:hypothetical protein
MSISAAEHGPRRGPRLGEVVGLAAGTRAGLVVLSSATIESFRLAEQAVGEIAHRLPGVRVPVGRPGETLTRLRDQAGP